MNLLYLKIFPSIFGRMVWILMSLLSQYNSSLFCCYCFLWNSVNSLQYQNNKNMCAYLQAIKILQLCLPSFLCKEWVKSFQSNAFKEEEGQGNSLAGIRRCSLFWQLLQNRNILYNVSYSFLSYWSSGRISSTSCSMGKRPMGTILQSNHSR